MMRGVALGAFVLLSCATLPASAFDVACGMVCTDNSAGSSCMQNCANNNNSGSGGGARHVPKYAAIAISPSTLEWGSAYNFTSRQQAEEAAMTYCYTNKSKPKDCEIGVWFYDSCGSLAIKANTLADGKNDGAWGADWATSKKGAEKKALKQCQKYGGEACKPAATFCAAQ